MQLPNWWREATTITLAAEAFNMSRVWLHELVKKYNVPSFRIGNTLYVHSPTLEKIVTDKSARR